MEPAKRQGPDIEMNGMGQGDQSALDESQDKEKCCNIACTAKTVVKVAIPTIVIGGVLFGVIYYGIVRFETFLDGKLSTLVTQATDALKEDFQQQAQNIIKALNETITGAIGSISSSVNATVTSAISTSISEGMQQLESNLQASIQRAEEELMEAIKQGN